MFYVNVKGEKQVEKEFCIAFARRLSNCHVVLKKGNTFHDLNIPVHSQDEAVWNSARKTLR